MEIKELQEKALETVKQRLVKLGVKYNKELYMLHLTEEVGELARQIVNKKLKRKEIDIKKTMCHHTLKGVVCDRHLFLGCSRIEDK